MMTSSNWNIFRVTDPLCGEFTGHRWIPRTKASDAELWRFLSNLCLNKRLSKQSWGWLFETPLRSLWCHCNDNAVPTKLPTLKVLDGIRTTTHNKTPNVLINIIDYTPTCRTHFVSSIHSRRYTSWSPCDARSWCFKTFGTDLIGTHRPTLLFALRQLIRIAQLTLFQNNQCLET